jgi:hypothetical protein
MVNLYDLRFSQFLKYATKNTGSKGKIDKSTSLKLKTSQDANGHVCNPSYSGGRVQEDLSSKPA